MLRLGSDGGWSGRALHLDRRDGRQVLDAVKARGSLICGIGQGTAGFMLRTARASGSA